MFETIIAQINGMTRIEGYTNGINFGSYFKSCYVFSNILDIYLSIVTSLVFMISLMHL